MNNKITFAIFLSIFFTANLYSQSTPDEANHKPMCGTDLVHSKLLNSNPAFREEQEKFEKHYQNVVNSTNNQTENILPIDTFPTVVHIIHNCAPLGTTANPTDATVRNVIEQASQRFRHMHPGAGTYTNVLYGIDTEIELCLANVDPSGNYTTGIIRHNDAVNNIGDYNTVGPNLSADYKWDDTKYNNIFVISDLTNAAGVYMGGYDITIYDSGSFWSGLVAHEIGHYFNLRHTFQSSGGVCPPNTTCTADGDFVCDTPPKNVSGYNGGSCASPGNSCTTDEADTSTNNPYRPVANGGLGDQNDMLENYMDYTGGCWDAFTEGQKVRMKTNISSNRMSQVNHAAIACGTAVLPANDAAIIGLDPNSIPCTQDIAPQITIQNNGTNNLTSLTITLMVDGMTVNTNWTGNLTTGSSEVVSLSTISLSTGSYTIDVSATSPNGLVDGFDNNNTYCAFASVGTTSFPYLQTVESFTTNYNASGYSDGWTVSPSATTSSYRWNINSGTTPSDDTGPSVDHTTNTATGKYIYSEASQAGAPAELISPCIDIPNTAVNPLVSFWYHMYGATIGTLHIDLYNGTNWINDISPAIVGQQQTSSTDAWIERTIDLSSYINSSIQIRFRAERGASFTGDIAIDDFELLELVVLPVELTKFEGRNNDKNEHILSWETQSEINSSHFLLEHSGDGRNFLPLQKIQAKGNSDFVSHYQFINTKPAYQDNYYRLKIVNMDNSFEYSSVVYLPLNHKENQIIITPNPSKGIFQLNKTSFDKDLNIKIYNSIGQLVQETTWDKNENNFSLNLTSQSNGIYWVQVFNQNRLITLKRLVKM